MNVTITPKKLTGSIRAISSKSFAHRFLICAALANEKSRIIIPDLSDDVRATAECLCAMGAGIEYSDGCFTVTPLDKSINGFRSELHCAESGSTLRFLAPVVSALGGGTFVAGGRLTKRPMDDLDAALQTGGVRVSRNQNRITYSGKLTGGDLSVSGSVSSQYISGLLLALPLIGGNVTLKGELASAPYVEMTRAAMGEFGVATRYENGTYTAYGTYRGGERTVPGDWSNAAFWITAGVRVTGLDDEYTHISGDSKITEILKDMGAVISTDAGVSASYEDLHGFEIDARDLPDLVPILSVAAGRASGDTVFRGVSRLRTKESDRIESTCSMLASLGVSAEASGDLLIVHGTGKPLSGGTVDSFGDHRIAMSAAIAACFADREVTVTGAEAVGKSYPAYWDDYKKLGGDIHVEYDR